MGTGASTNRVGVLSSEFVEIMVKTVEIRQLHIVENSNVVQKLNVLQWNWFVQNVALGMNLLIGSSYSAVELLTVVHCCRFLRQIHA